MNRFPGWVLHHRAAVLLAAALLVVLGTATATRLPIDAFPDVTNQQVMVLAEASGLGPLDVEQQVTFPIETVLGGLPGVQGIRSLSKTGLAQVVVVFEDRMDTYLARQLVFERLQLAREQLPPGVEPELGPISTGLGEVFQYTLESDERDLAELRALQDWVVAPRLRMIPGVNEINSFGGYVRQVHVRVDPGALVQYRVPLAEVVDAVSANNANAGGGFLVRGWEQENVRAVGLFGSLQDVRDVVLRAEDGTPIRLADVADVVEGHMTRHGAVSRDAQGEVVCGTVIMLKGENAKEVVERVKAALPAIERSLPDDVSFEVFYDRIDLVRAVIGTVSWALLQGGFLVILVLFLFVGNLRAALVTAMSLPLTALFAFVLMGASGVSANLMSLGGLAIAVGMVVDGSIVVAENASRRLRAAGADPAGRGGIALHVDALREVARPVAFSILVIVLVFLPLFTLEGMEGKMFRPLALTMIFAMLGALVVSQTIVPVVLSLLLRDGHGLGEPRWMRALRQVYLRLLARTLDRPGATVIAAAVVFLATLLPASRLGSEFLPDLDEGAIAINVVRLPNAGLDGSVATAGHLERILGEFPEVEAIVSKTGRAEISEDPMGPDQSDLLVMLKPRKEWNTGRSKAELVQAMQERLQRVPGIRPAFSQPIALRVNELISGIKSDLAVKIFGEDLAVLKEAADEIGARLRGIDGAGDVSVEPIVGLGSLEVVPDRRALARHQLNVTDVTRIVETAVGGTVATEMVEGPRRIGVLVRFPEDVRDDPAAIAAILVPTPAGALVPLGELAALRRVEGPAQVSHENMRRRVVVEANVRGRDLGGFVAEARDALADIEAGLPSGSWIEYGGTFESQRRAMSRLGVVVPLSILLIFLMLASGLGSARTAGLVLVNLPFALVGGLLAMLVFGIRLNVPATVGFIALFGIAVQNGTVLVTFVEQLRREGRSIRDAVVEACGLRFRALLMTAATTVLGLVPMLWASGPGSEMQRPLAAVVIGGLVTATLLTLLVLPTIYSWARPPLPAAAAEGAGIPAARAEGSASMVTSATTAR